MNLRLCIIKETNQTKNNFPFLTLLYFLFKILLRGGDGTFGTIFFAISHVFYVVNVSGACTFV